MQKSHRTTAGAHPHVAVDVPRFRHRAPWLTPRYAPVIALLWLTTFIGAVLRFIQGIHWDHTDWHDVGDGAILTVCFVLTCLLWNAWEREERYPELLPKREFERRYPPTPASPPPREYHRRIPYVEDVTATGSTVEPGDDRCG